MDIIQVLVKNKKIEKKDSVRFKAQAREQGKTDEEILLESKVIAEEELFRLKSKELNIPLKEALPQEIPGSVISIIPKESVEFYKMVPLAVRKEAGILEVGMVYPENSQAQEALKFLARQQNLAYEVFLMPLSVFAKALSKYQAPEREVEEALKGLEREMRLPGQDVGELALEKAKFARLVEEAPIIKMVAVILRQAVEGSASDIHIEPTREQSKVRYRMDGILYPSLILPLKAHPAIVARIKILSNLKIDETRMPQDGRFSTKMADKRIDFRVSTFPTTLGEKVVLRVLDADQGLKSLEDLGLTGFNLKKMHEVIKKPYGMILVTGPTGSGKSTTLYAVLKILNRPEVNIVTLEDPVEYFMSGISQSQVKPEINYTFARGLRQILRQDPDIIMVGEIRDEETANLAVHAALTGHLVLSTLHTNNATGAVPRLVDMGIKPFLLPATLALALSQRLVRKLCPHCKQKIKAGSDAKKYILEKSKNMPADLKVRIKPPFEIYKPKGCKKCNNKGYSGRSGIFEALEMTDKVAEIVNKGSGEAEIFEAARAQGMITMVEDGILKVLDGITTLEEIMRVAEEK